MKRSILGTVALGAAAALFVGGCSSSGEAEKVSAETRAVQQDRGSVSVPVEPQKLVALDEYSALTALTLGVKPDTVFASLQSGVAKQILESEGVTVVDSPTFLQNPDVEQVATIDPDMIVFSNVGGPIPEMVDQFDTVAPTVSLEYAAPWRDVLADAGRVFGREDRAAEVESGLAERFAAVNRAVSESPKSMSVLVGFSGGLYTAVADSPISSMIDEAGFSRPQAELDATTGPGTGVVTAAVSGETVSAHAADIQIVTAGNMYDAQLVRSNPLFAQLPATLEGRALDVSGDLWFGSYPFAVHWILSDLEAIAAGSGQDAIGQDSDAVARWTAFEGR